jgi:hypothetical protein
MAEERVESDGFYEMLWDCAHCGTKGLLGKSQRRCPECGAPQEADKRYFPSEEQKREATGHVYEGADAHCPSCSAPMGARVKNCTQCGSPMDGGKEVLAAVTPAPAATPAKPAKPAKKSHVGLIVAIIAVLLVGGGAAVWALFFRTKSGTVTVAKHRWQAMIAVEQYGDQERSAWRNEVPFAASRVLCHQEQRGSHQVPDGEDCHTEKHDKKDGTYEQVKKCSPKTRSVPDYDDKCTYIVQAWNKVADLKTSGDGTTIAFASSDLPAVNAPSLPGTRRQGARSETLSLDFANGGSCDWSTSPGAAQEAEWRRIADGAALQVNLRARSDDVVCDSVIP